MVSRMHRDRTLDVPFAQTTILRRRDRRRERVRRQRRGHLAHQSADVADDAAGEEVLVRELRGGFTGRARLHLSRILLYALVRHLEAGLAVPHDGTEPIRAGEVALEMRRDVRPGAVIREVLLDRG